MFKTTPTFLIFYLLILRERGRTREGGRERETPTSAARSVTHSSADSWMCPDWDSDLKLWHVRTMFHLAELPGRAQN